MGEIKADKIQYVIGHDEGDLYEVTRDFLMTVCDGPLVTAKAGEIVFLEKQFGSELFYCGKVVPVELGENYEVVTDFQTVQDGKYFRAKKGDIVKLARDEAISLLREAKVKHKKGGN